MLELTYQAKASELLKMRNIAEKIGDEDLRAIGSLCKQEFDADKASRAEWEGWYADAMKLALQVMEEKTYPWPSCSNVKFPLITIAAINFHAKAYPALLNGKQVVSYRPIGDDPDGMISARATRVENHQNYLLLEGSDWEEQVDRALINLPIMGCCFKKTFYDHDSRLVASKLVLAMNLVVPYYTISLEMSPRVSEIFSLSPNTFKTRIRRKQYLAYEQDAMGGYTPDYSVLATDAMKQAQFDAQKVTPSPTFDSGTPIGLIEQHRTLDLDGDGYEEPYVVTFVQSTGQVCRIVARYDTADIERNDVTVGGEKQISYIAAHQYYTKYSFIPSPDGGFYDMGFGMLLGPLNYAVDSLINQLIDAGTMSNLGGGFLGRGIKLRRGENTFEPLEWKTIDSTGSSLKDNIVPLPTRQPSQALLDLLTFLVQYSERISSANEVQMGELPGQNAKSGAMEIANANGLKIFAALYKRLWRCFKEEFVKVYEVTARYSQSAQWGKGGRSQATGKWFQLKPDDYSSLSSAGIWPAANPDVASREQEVAQAREVMNSALNIPGQNVYAAVMRYYRALRVPNPDEIYPDPNDPKLAIPAKPDSKMIDSQARMLVAQARQQEVEYQKSVAFAKAMDQIQKTQAEIQQLMAQAEKLKADASGVPMGHAIALLDAQIGMKHEFMKGTLEVLKLLNEGVKNAEAPSPSGANGSGNGGGNSLQPMAAAGGNPTVSPLPTGSLQ